MYASANFLCVFFAWPFSFIFVAAVSTFAKLITIVVITIVVAMVHFASSWLFNLIFFIFKLNLAAFSVTESSSLLALDSFAEPRAPVQALFTIGANERLFALAFCFVRPEEGKFRNRVIHAVVPFHVRLLTDPRVKSSSASLTRGNLPVVECIEALFLPSLLDIHIGAIEVLLFRL